MMRQEGCAECRINSLVEHGRAVVSFDRAFFERTRSMRTPPGTVNRVRVDRQSFPAELFKGVGVAQGNGISSSHIHECALAGTQLVFDDELILTSLGIKHFVTETRALRQAVAACRVVKYYTLRPESQNVVLPVENGTSARCKFGSLASGQPWPERSLATGLVLHASKLFSHFSGIAGSWLASQ